MAKVHKQAPRKKQRRKLSLRLRPVKLTPKEVAKELGWWGVQDELK